MASYCPSSELTNLLPPNHGLSAAQLTTCINAGSGDVDGQLSHLYWPFPNYAAGPPVVSPPWVIRQAAWYFSAFHAYHLMHALELIDDTTSARDFWNVGTEILNDYAEGKKEIPPETQTDTLISSSWGDGDPLTTQQAALSKSQVEVIPESAYIASSDYQNGLDFFIYYYKPTRQWIIERADSDIGSGSGAPGSPGNDLTYTFSYLRKREIIKPGLRTVELRRA